MTAISSLGEAELYPLTNPLMMMLSVWRIDLLSIPSYDSFCFLYWGFWAGPAHGKRSNPRMLRVSLDIFSQMMFLDKGLYFPIQLAIIGMITLNLVVFAPLVRLVPRDFPLWG